MTSKPVLVWYNMGMKKCYKCKKEKPLSEYHKSSRRSDGRQSDCKECRSDYKREHYVNNKAKYIEQAKEKKIRDRQFLNELKDSPCLDCGGSFPPCAMDFDHMPGHEKVGNVGRMIDFSRASILSEIEKCELVCANCHRVRTHKRNMY